MASPHITIVTEKNFEDEVLKSDKLVLIDFYADWCGPCKAFSPTLDKLADDRVADVKVVKINVDNDPAIADAFGIKSIPTIVTLKDGKGLLGASGNLPRSAVDQVIDQSLQLAQKAHITPKAGDKPPRNDI